MNGSARASSPEDKLQSADGRYSAGTKARESPVASTLRDNRFGKHPLTPETSIKGMHDPNRPQTTLELPRAHNQKLFNHHQTMTPNILPSEQPLSRMTQNKEANELRKTLKPLMEKRRRARINESIDHLKALIIPLVGKETSRYSKLEKADILEMTVRYLKNLSPAKAPADCYREGYEACLQRVSALLPRTSLHREARSRVHEFIQQSQSVPWKNCSTRSPSIPHPTQKQALNPKSALTSQPNLIGLIRPNSDRAHAASQASSHNVWRPW